MALLGLHMLTVLDVSRRVPSRLAPELMRTRAGRSDHPLRAGGKSAREYHFLAMLKQTAPRLSAETLETLRAAIAKR
jgi:hypothetical protein